MIKSSINTRLSAEELAICKNLNISESEYIKANNMERASKNNLTPQSALSADELSICKKLNISEKEYIEANKGSQR